MNDESKTKKQLIKELAELREKLAGYDKAGDIAGQKFGEEALKESMERSRAIFESALDAIIMIDGQGIITDFNPAAEKIFGYRKSEAVGRGLHTFLVSEKVRAEYDRTLPNFQKTGQCRVVGKPIELTATRRDGTRFPVEVSIVALQMRGEWHAVGTLKDITRRKRSEEKLQSLVLTDELTGLYNRRGFFNLAQQLLRIAKRGKAGILLISADLDGLKQINDTFGHHEGDIALVEAADIIRETFRESDIIARIGGDEFVVAMTTRPDVSSESLKARLQENLDLHNAKSARGYALSISMGIAGSDTDPTPSIDKLLIEADKTMYREKKDKLK